MTPSIKLIGGISAILLLAGGFFVFDWSERYQRRDSAQAQLRERQLKWTQLRTEIAEYPKLQQETRHKRSQLDQAMAGTGGREAGDDLVANYLVEVERRANGLNIRSITPAAANERARVFNLSMEGSYANLVDFLYELSARRLDRVVTINSLRLGQAHGGKLNIELPVTAYPR
ncbi:MAG: type 4a pilus biogenesis protein PilO [Vulcanimicrobiota bacterium]